jgi:REP element-mobilizing transposase RayT
MKIYHHVVFTLKNSRYDIFRLKRKNPIGYVAPTYPFIEGKEEEILIEELCDIANNIGLDLIEMNFCGDHVHCIIKSETAELSRMMMLWKGKTSYIFNRRINPSFEGQPVINSKGTKQGLWAKSYYQKRIETTEQLKSTIIYIKNNRKKHGLQPLSAKSLEKIEKTIIAVL